MKKKIVIQTTSAVLLFMVDAIIFLHDNCACRTKLKYPCRRLANIVTFFSQERERESVFLFGLFMTERFAKTHSILHMHLHRIDSGRW